MTPKFAVHFDESSWFSEVIRAALHVFVNPSEPQHTCKCTWEIFDPNFPPSSVLYNGLPQHSIYEAVWTVGANKTHSEFCSAIFSIWPWGDMKTDPPAAGDQKSAPHWEHSMSCPSPHSIPYMLLPWCSSILFQWSVRLLPPRSLSPIVTVSHCGLINALG